jgi:hypothetical protein
MLSKKGRWLKEVAYCCSGAGGEVQVVAGYCDHQNVAAVLAKSMEVSFYAAPLLLLITAEIRFLA